MNDRLTSWLRTVVPTAWSAVIAWLVSLGAPEWLSTALGGLTDTFVVPVVLATVYAGLRWLEPRIPAWLATVLLGSSKYPVYLDR